LDVENCGLNLEAAWTKNRKAGFQEIPLSLIERLKDFIKNKSSEDTLAYFASHPCRDLAKDLAAAGIPKWTHEGKIDFHALRVSYITFIEDVGGHSKEAQALGRHSSIAVTQKSYLKARSKEFRPLVEAVGALIYAKPIQEPVNATDAPTDAPSGLAGLLLGRKYACNKF
jgi:hypothetical protein